MAQAKQAANRPLSPHLQIYRPLLTMMMSIFHRITGAALYVGSFLFVWWLIAAAAGPDYFDLVSDAYKAKAARDFMEDLNGAMGAARGVADG